MRSRLLGCITETLHPSESGAENRVRPLGPRGVNARDAWITVKAGNKY